jgi:hypothetical protein
MSPMTRFLSWLYPELKAFGNEENRRKALAKCTTLFGKENWLSWVLGLGGSMLWAAIWRLNIASPLAEYLFMAGVPKPIGIVILSLSLMVVIVALLAIGLWIETPPTRERLRKLMTEEQDRYCQSCGYNLTGNVSGVCPECGESI